jgi:DNA-binding MarR family transcriptional regulator
MAAEPTDSLVDSLVRLSFAVQAILARVGATHDISIVQARLLGILRDREPTMAQLARHLNLDKSSVTGLVDRAERRGLVRRAATPVDGRSIQVALTEHGRVIATTFAAEVEAAVDALVAGFSGTDVTRLRLLAGRVVQRDMTVRTGQ